MALGFHDLVVAELPLAACAAVDQIDRQQDAFTGERLIGFGRGVGIVEAPRGTLIHDYTTDDNGCIVKANLIVGTTHNIAPMNMSVKQAATTLIKNGVYNEGLLNQVEMAVRAYDP